ncbi:MAG: DUF4185 domain-containing protein [Cyanobacteria bacterium J06634_5]
MLKDNALKVFIFGLVLCLTLACGRSRADNIEAPYPASTAISNIVFDWDTHIRQAPGSDNWIMTWASDGHQYSAWGDGGGFKGTNRKGRVSLGVARIEGDKDAYVGVNVWGGQDAENPATAEGKSYGLISIEGILYMWVSPGSNAQGYRESRLYQSNDQGASWAAADWAFEQSDGLIFPTFIQYGQDYQGARDEYVYIYANYLKEDTKLAVQKPGEIALMRVSKTGILDRSQYAFFSGINEDGDPVWSPELERRSPAFTDQNGVGWTTSVSYNPALQRYFLMTEHDKTFESNLGIFDAPEPWGPWTTVLYDRLNTDDIEQTAFFYNFANKWLSEDGKDFVLVFTGIKSNDSWNTVEGRFETSQ